MTLVEIIGYIASLIVIISLVMKSVLRLRIISFVGAVLWLIYGVMLNAPPIYITNGIIIAINIYFLYQMLSEKHYFRILEVDKDSTYLQNFIDFYQADIGRFFPQFRYNAARADLVYFILRDMLPVGLFVTERDPSGRALVDCDYVIAGYRDLQAGKFLYRELETRLPAKGVRTLYSVPGSDEHQKYLQRMGFMPTAESTSGGLFQRSMTSDQ
jgi:Bacterial inner membrane protein